MIYSGAVAPFLVVLAALMVAGSLVFLVRGSIMRAGDEAAPPAIPAPEPRIPADTSRTYPRPKGSRSKLNRVCPVCGSSDETGPLDGRVLGWPAHRSCAEWLGDWWPGKLPFEDADGPPPFSPDKTLIGYVEQGQKSADPGPITVGPVTQQGGTNTIHYVGGTAVTWGAGGAGGSSTSNMALTSEQEAIRAMLASGTISLDEARERLERDMATTFGIPGPGLGDSAAWNREAEWQARKRHAPVFPEYCTCGKGFTGTAEENRRALDAHHAAGECPHSVKGREQPQSSSSPDA